MNIVQFRYAQDNLSYLIYENNSALAVDGGAVDQILAFVRRQGLKLLYVTNTHSHADHTPGNRRLVEETGAEYLSPADLVRRKTLLIDQETIHAHPTPGHSLDSITLHAGHALITGDLLFNGTVGNCFTGDLKGCFNSIQWVLRFPPETIIYAGHDYVREAMTFARRLEPDHPHIDAFMKAYDPACVRSTLAQELKVNPYLRFNDPAMIRLLEKKGLNIADEFRRWTSLMSLE